MRKEWLLVYALALGIVICCFLIVNGLERRTLEQRPAPIQLVTPSPRTTLIDPVTTTPFPTRTP